MSATRPAAIEPFVGGWVRIEGDDGTTSFSATGWLRANAPGSALPFAVHDAMGGIFQLDPSTVVDVVPAPPPPGIPAARAPSPEQRSVSQMLEATAHLAALIQSQEESADRQRRLMHETAAAQHATAEAQRLALLEQTNAANAAGELRARRAEEHLTTAETAAAAQRQALLEQTNAANAAAELPRAWRSEEPFAAAETAAAAREERLAAHEAAEARDQRAADDRRRDAEAAEARERRSAEAQRALLDTMAAIATEVRSLSTRVERLSTHRASASPVPINPGGSPVPSPEHRPGPELPPPPQFASTGFAGSTATIEASVLALIARDEEAARHKLPIWSSHDISPKLGADIFSAAQRTSLTKIPELCILRAESDFDELKLTIRGLADVVIELETLGSPALIETHFRTLLRRGTGREEAALSPERFVALQSSLTLLSTSSRPRALSDLALFALRLAPAYAKATARLERILVASISVRPRSVTGSALDGSTTPHRHDTQRGRAAVDVAHPLLF